MSQEIDVVEGLPGRRVRGLGPQLDTLTLDTKLSELALDSVLVLEVVSQVEQSLSVRFDDEDLSHLTTMRDLGELIDKSRRAAYREEATMGRLAIARRASLPRVHDVLREVGAHPALERLHRRPVGQGRDLPARRRPRAVRRDLLRRGDVPARLRGAGHQRGARDFGQAWFQANWAYEESKHSLVLREYLHAAPGSARYERDLRLRAARSWPSAGSSRSTTSRQMTLYGAIQEMTTFVIYKKQEKMARAQGRRAPGVDLRAHRARRDRPLPLLREGRGLAPRGGSRGHEVRSRLRVPSLHHAGVRPRARATTTASASCATAGIDRGVFITEVWLTILKRLGLTRHDLPPPSRRRECAPECRDIAIVGMACRFPQAPDLGAYWDNIRAARVCFSEIPRDRWNHELFYHPGSREIDKTYARKVGLLTDDIWSFAAMHYGLPPLRVKVTDPQHRILLDAVRGALADAGYERRPLPRPHDRRVHRRQRLASTRTSQTAALRAPQMADGQFGRGARRRRRPAAAVEDVDADPRLLDRRQPAQHDGGDGGAAVRPGRAGVHHRRGLLVVAGGDLRGGDATCAPGCATWRSPAACT